MKDIERHLRTDLDSIPTEAVDRFEGVARAKAIIAMVFLRVWTRMVLDTGRKLQMSPSQYRIGTYKGKMNWILNEGGLDGVTRLEMTGGHVKDYAFVGEAYELNGVARMRILFSFQEDEVKGKPVFVSYLVYDGAVADFNREALVDVLGPAIPEWMSTIVTGNKEALWAYSKERFECVGM